MIEPERIRHLNGNDDGLVAQKPAAFVLYWMQAAGRAVDNPALWYAATRADEQRLPLLVLFVLTDYPAATAAQYRWMLHGLRECAASLREAGVGFSIRRGDPVDTVLAAAKDAALVVCDRSPARWSVLARNALASRLRVSFVEVDGESVVPEAVASHKQEWSARTFRMRTAGAIALYASRLSLAVPTPKKSAHSLGYPSDEESWASYDATPPPAYPGDRSPEQRFSLRPGYQAARERLESFIANNLDAYDSDRNDPCKDGTSGLSAYLHFGQISSLDVLRAARLHGGPGYPAYAEQLVVRRELARNFVRFRVMDYDSWEGLPAWSREALERAAGDRRAYAYTRDDFEASATHDPYWNAAQEQLVRTGTIHNYMRMYWGKMLLAWSRSPREAFDTGVYLNDRYALDGRDPNGWTGVAWCFGLHDRPWPSRPVFGTVRSMTAAGLRRKFDADLYAETWSPRGAGAGAAIQPGLGF